MNILIIGCGFLGFKTGEVLRKKGYKITGATRSKEKLSELKNYLGNSVLWTPENIPAALQEHDIIIFCAAPASQSLYKETYLDNALFIAQEAKRSARLKQIIYTSSTSVYGDAKGQPVTEESCLASSNPLTHILIQTEQVLKDLPQTCILRLGELIGQDRTLEDRLRALRGTPLPGDGETITNFSPRSDVIRGIEFAIEKPLFGTYNLCSDLHSTRNELYHYLTAARDIPSVQWDPTKASHQVGSKTVISDKIKKEGFEFKAPLWEGILNGIESATASLAH